MSFFSTILALLALLGGIAGFSGGSGGGSSSSSPAAAHSGTDYGNAPEPYLGAIHDDQSLVWLGTKQTNTITDSNKDNGYLIGLDDGLDFVDQFVIGETVSINYSLSSSSNQVVYVKTWLDWNQDGDWFDDKELIFSGNYTFSDSYNFTDYLYIDPDLALVGDTWLRVRVTVDGNDFGPTTNLIYGEVEDYKISIVTYPEDSPNLNPEPATMILFGSGLLALSGIGFKRKKR